MKTFIFSVLSWCFPLDKFDTSWRARLSLAVIEPPHKQSRIKKLLVADFPPVAQHDSLLAWTVSLGIFGIGVVLIRLLL